MANKLRTPRLPDPSQMAFAIIQVISGEAPAPLPKPPKNPKAVARGIIGGRAGGQARAAKMTKEERSASAKKAAAARWAK